ncbi:MAG: sulfotransferase family 2 domain-containing protein [Paracoccaceae bacterium]|nr:MAG: sulfotransferase family 2 domain-containing protein [Paracoccaceae bacterium]
MAGAARVKRLFRALFPSRLTSAAAALGLRRERSDQGQAGDGGLTPEGRPDPRPTPFAPRGTHAPVFFMHIPKTSGSSINTFLSQVYGSDNFIAHAEYRMPSLMHRREPTLEIDGVSAHVPLCRWTLLRGTDAYARATILRDPWERLVSHVNWVDRFNHGEPLPEGATAAAVKRVVGQMARTDYSNADDLLALMAVVADEAEFTAFDNMQVRMLLTGDHRAVFKRLVEGDVDVALRSLDDFMVVGICEDQARFQRDFLAATGLEAPIVPRHENIGAPKALRADNDVARQVLAPWIALDQVLYDTAKRAMGLA